MRTALWIVLTVAAVACLAASPGCSLQATPEMATQMASDAVAAGLVVDANAAGTRTADAARVYIPRGGQALLDYYQAATVNLFAYWFDPAKRILVDPAGYNRLQAYAVNAQDVALHAGMAASQPFTDPESRAVAVGIAQTVISVNNVRQGKQQ